MLGQFYSPSVMYSVHRQKCMFFFLLFHVADQTLYGTVFRHDNARSHAACHTTQFLANSNVQILTWPSMSPDLKINTLRTGWRDMIEAEWMPLQMCSSCFRPSSRTWWPSQRKCAPVVSGPQAGLDGHPSANDLQPDPVHAWEMLSSYWFSRRTRSLLLCLSLSPKILSDQTFSRMSI